MYQINKEKNRINKIGKKTFSDTCALKKENTCKNWIAYNA